MTRKKMLDHAREILTDAFGELVVCADLHNRLKFYSDMNGKARSIELSCMDPDTIDKPPSYHLKAEVLAHMFGVVRSLHEARSCLSGLESRDSMMISMLNTAIDDILSGGRENLNMRVLMQEMDKLQSAEHR